MQTNIMYVRSDQYELTQHGTTAFPFASYESCLHKTPEGYFETHWHPELQFCFPLGDSVIEVKVENKPCVLHPGDGLFINQHRMHSVYPVKQYDSTYVSTLFSPKMIGLFPGSEIECECVTPILQNENLAYIFLHGNMPEHEKIVKCMNKIHDLFSNKAPEKKLMLCANLMNLWADLLGLTEGVQSASQKPADQLRTKLMINYILEHYQKNITLQDLAMAVNLSRSECCRIFKRMVGKTPIEYVLHFRIGISIDLLLHTNYNISEIAYQVGFGSASSYIERFHTIVGCPPGVYRKRHQL